MLVTALWYVHIFSTLSTTRRCVLITFFLFSPSVIPLTLSNAWSEAAEADIGITAMINTSPYAYGCTDEDIIDIMPYINEQAENKK